MTTHILLKYSVVEIVKFELLQWDLCVFNLSLMAFFIDVAFSHLYATKLPDPFQHQQSNIAIFAGLIYIQPVYVGGGYTLLYNKQ